MWGIPGIPGPEFRPHAGRFVEIALLTQGAHEKSATVRRPGLAIGGPQMRDRLLETPRGECHLGQHHVGGTLLGIERQGASRFRDSKVPLP